MVDELDYEQKKQYELTVRATDSVSGVFAEVLVSILVQDVNDCPPEFTQDSYNISVSEAAPFGTSVLKVTSRDNDTGIFTLLFTVILQISAYYFLMALVHKTTRSLTGTPKTQTLNLKVDKSTKTSRRILFLSEASYLGHEGKNNVYLMFYNVLIITDGEKYYFVSFI